MRLVLAGAGIEEITGLAQAYDARLVPAPARFEDAFIDLLGGGPGGVSGIAARMAPSRNAMA